MGEPLAILEAEYCPPLDSAVVSAIALDYDLSAPAELQDCRMVLHQLRESASFEEATDFDPSGTRGNAGNAVEGKSANSCLETSTGSSRDTDLTSVSARLSSLGLDQDQFIAEAGILNADTGSAHALERLDEATKVQLLQEVFGDRVSKYSIQHTVRKCNGRWQTALEELLNHVYLNEDASSEDGGRVPTKGIEAFSEDQLARRGRKGKKPKNQRIKQLESRRSSSLPSSAHGAQTPPENIWETASKDVSFIANRTGIAASTVSSTYYDNGASIPRTISALLKAFMQENKVATTSNAAMTENTQELAQDFPSISPEYVTALVRLTHPSTAAAHELAKALTTTTSIEPRANTHIVPQYTPIDVSLLNSPDEQRDMSGVVASSPHLTKASSSAAGDRAATYAAAQSLAFAQARAAHRKAKSDRLMGGAAAYYGQAGREYSALAFGENATVANNLANAQSSSTHVDLHGIDVVNAVRIARERVEEWWNELGESKVNGRVGAADRQAGFRVVVGRGVHSEGGRRKLGPAVAKMLKEDGWRFEDTGAAFLVKGKTRH